MTPARPQAARLGVDHLMSLMSPVPLPRTPPRPPPPAASSQYWLALARTHLILHPAAQRQRPGHLEFPSDISALASPLFPLQCCITAVIAAASCPKAPR